MENNNPYIVKIVGPQIQVEMAVGSKEDFKIMLLFINKMEKRLGITWEEEDNLTREPILITKRDGTTDKVSKPKEEPVPHRNKLEDAPKVKVPAAVHDVKYIKIDRPVKHSVMGLIDGGCIPWRWTVKDKNGFWHKNFYVRLGGVGSHVEVAHFDNIGKRIETECKTLQLPLTVSKQYAWLRQLVYNAAQIGHTLDITEQKEGKILEEKI